MKKEMDIETLRERVSQLNREIANKGLRTVNAKTGKQKMEFWLPEEMKQMLIEEANRPGNRKTHIAIVKYFVGGWTWWFSEYEPRPDEHIGDFFGLVKGLEVELGYTNLKELRGIRHQNIWPVERDYHFTPETLENIQQRIEGR